MRFVERFSASFVLFACVLLPVFAFAQNTTTGQRQVRDTVVAMAFEPSAYFRDQEFGDLSMIRIVDTGDDYGWPVYAIAILRGCLPEEALAEPCVNRLTARMVRSPAPMNMSRPRQRGLHLVGALLQRHATSRNAIASQLRDIGVDWMEADLASCPGVESVMARSASLSWVPEDISNPAERNSISIVLHADKVRVEFEQYARISIYEGYIGDNLPSEWADQLAEVLEPCWRPASTKAPWDR